MILQKVLLIGATGTVGSAVRRILLKETNIQLTLFSRTANHLSIDPQRERIINGDVMQKEKLTAAIKDQDVVFVALSGDLPAFAKQIIDTMEKEQATRLIFIASMGIYNENPQSIGSEGNLKFNPMLKPYRKAADIIENSGFTYTIIRPGWFDHGSEEYEITQKNEPFGGHNVAINSIADLVKTAILKPELFGNSNIGINRKKM